jgi:RNA polymerase sigma-70 factor (ECF subfamily)
MLAPMTSSATEPVGALDRDHLADLVEAVARSADKNAFATLFSFYAPRVKAYLLRLGADHATADELVQEVMVTVWRKAPSFDRRQASVSTWLFTIARNRRIDVIRRERRPEFDPDDPLFVPDPEPSPDDVAVRTEQDKRLKAALKTLPSEQLTLVEAAFYGGKSHRDIADETGIPLGTVKSRLRLAFTRLKKALDGDI